MIHGAQIGKNAREVNKGRMNCMVIFVVFDVLLISAVLARPDKTIRSAKYILNLKSATSSTIPDREDKKAQASISGSGLDGHHAGINTGYRMLSERVRTPLQMSTRREYGISHTDACLFKTEILNPKTYFNTDDNFFPASFKTTVCTGAIGKRSYPNCVYGRLDCVLLKEDIVFLRKPTRNCTTWYKDFIKDVPVGCQCMWPH